MAAVAGTRAALAGICICAGDDVAFLYWSLTTRPLDIEAFEDEEAAESFLAFVSDTGEDLRALGPVDWDAMRATWQDLPKCRECGERVVKPGKRTDECEGCRPVCDAPGDCHERGTAIVWGDDIGEHGIWRFCGEHEKDARRGAFRGQLR